MELISIKPLQTPFSAIFHIDCLLCILEWPLLLSLTCHITKLSHYQDTPEITFLPALRSTTELQLPRNLVEKPPCVPQVRILSN